MEKETSLYSARKILSILEELEQVQSTSITVSDQISGYFCSDTVFNLSKKVLSDMELKVLEKGLDNAPIQNKINETELKGDFEDFARRMRLKWYFRNEPTPSFSERPSFTPKSSPKPPKSNPSLELFLSHIEKELFEVCKSHLGYLNFSKQCMHLLANGRGIVIKKAGKGSYVVVWDGGDYIAEASKQLNDESVYKSVKFKHNILQDLAEKSNVIFKGLHQKDKITKKQLK